MTKQIELDEGQLDVVHELILRGLRQTDPSKREYGEAYDAFVEAADYPLRIGDQPERVRDVWGEITEENYHVSVRDTRTGRTRNCVECGEEIEGDMMIPEGSGPMHTDCWTDWMTDSQ